MSSNETINYKYYHWGPLLYSTKVTPERVAKILEICNKAKDSNTHKLAGHIKKQLVLPPLKIFSILKPYFISYARVQIDDYGLIPLPILDMEGAWVNYMKAGDFNPPHSHYGILSFVLFLKVPNQLKKENEKYKGTSIGPGAIEFRIGLPPQLRNSAPTTHPFFPQEGDIFIFPAHLEHWVFPFKSQVIRVSISGNLVEKTKGI
tara:strand:+ start:759 stop:1370 length:612 start_codon:yes stop_codon:yes gene_type:complete